MRVFRKFQSSDGRIKIVTLSGVSALVAVIALLVGVLPVFASQPGATGEGVDPVPVDWGGGSGACDDALISLEDGTVRGPSAAEHELHINNPVPGTSTTYTGPDETEITITVDANDEFFEFSIGSGMVAYDVVVNGGKKSNHYEYDGASKVVPSDSHLSAPTKDNKEDEVHKLSHVNLCYDAPQVTFVCGGEPEDAILFGEGIFAGATGQIFNNSTPNVGCVEGDEKQGTFFIDNQAEETTLDFGDEGGVVAGRLDVTKEFGEPSAHEDFDDLKYDRDGSGAMFVDVAWCETRPLDNDDTDDEGNHPFDEWLPTDAENPSYPKLPVGETACKVAENEDMSGTQVTVVYFEFEDPQFR